MPSRASNGGISALFLSFSDGFSNNLLIATVGDRIQRVRSNRAFDRIARSILFEAQGKFGIGFEYKSSRRRFLTAIKNCFRQVDINKDVARLYFCQFGIY